MNDRILEWQLVWRLAMCVLWLGTCLFGLVLSIPFMWLLKPGDRFGFAMTIEGSVSEKIGEIEQIKAKLEFQSGALAAN